MSINRFEQQQVNFEISLVEYFCKISTDPGLLKIRHSHRFVAVVIQILIPFSFLYSVSVHRKTRCILHVFEVDVFKICIVMDGYSVVKAFVKNGQSFRSSHRE